jgi:hypothetical protein
MDHKLSIISTRWVVIVLCLLIGVGQALHTAAGSESWRVVSSPSPSVYGNIINGMAAISASDVWAVGSATTYSGSGTLIEHWDGRSWSVVSSPSPAGRSVLNDVAVNSAGDAWAVGYHEASNGAIQPLIEHWDGRSWSIVSSPSSAGRSVLNDVAVNSAGDAWAVGYHEASNGAIQPLIEHWDGKSWSIVSSPNPSRSTATVLNGVAAASANDVWGVGYYFDYQKQASRTLIMHWDGISWSLATSSSPNRTQNVLNAVAVVSATDVWAVGYMDDQPQTLVEHWDGSRWRVVSSPNLSATYGSANILRDIAVVSPTDVWAVGMFQNESTDYHQHRPLIEHWDGASWGVVSSPSPGKSAELNGAVALLSGEVFAGGLYSNYPINIYDGTYTASKTFNLKQ